MTGLSEQEALELFARCVAEIVGRQTEAYRDVRRAVRSCEVVDLLLAKSSFDALSPELRHRLSAAVTELLAQPPAGTFDGADPQPLRRRLRRPGPVPPGTR